MEFLTKVIEFKFYELLILIAIILLVMWRMLDME